MCKMMEDMRNEAAHEAAHDKVKEKAILMLKMGRFLLMKYRYSFPNYLMKKSRKSNLKSCS